jgi:hypothetical protein
MQRRWPLALAAGLALAAAHCRGAEGHADGVVVHQILHGTALLDEPEPAAARAAAPAAATGLAAATLVSDTPQAIYKQAADAARRQLDVHSARTALSRLQAQLDQEQESDP